jgi:UDP:flavonoid glycosyltransferase YjiC (YdhE family)
MASVSSGHTGRFVRHAAARAVTSLDKLTADHLSTLLNKVLYNSSCRNNARRMQKAFAEANGLSTAVDIIE